MASILWWHGKAVGDILGVVTNSEGAMTSVLRGKLFGDILVIVANN